ncbi:MAG: class A beta-lactamase-related serine hydrolase [Chitinophagaceae bacterium]|nr:MAG: class A beta-lactamase-related serine hydrolase [Chitinophagaceae bacterium]
MSRKAFIMFKNIVPIAAIVLLLASCKKDSNPTPDPQDPAQQDITALDSKMSQWMTSNGMPGMSLAISKNGKLVYSKAYGVGDKETAAHVTTGSEFRVASVSKLITSVAVMKLVQDAKLTMDQKVFGTGGILGTTYGTQPYRQYVTDITLSHLLHHTEGGWGQANDPAFFDKNLDATALINYTLNNVALTKAPGTSFDYSNFGYILLEKIIEKASGKSYASYVNDEIWQKVGASQSAIAATSLSGRTANEVKYYGQGGDANFVYDYIGFNRAAGAMGWRSTPADLLRFVNAVDSSDTRPDILSLPTIKTMVTTTPASTGFGGMQFGCGWVIENGEWFWWGSLPGTFAILYRNANGMCIAATSNSRKQPTPENSLYSFISVINYAAFDASIPWQDIDQFGK